VATLLARAKLDDPDFYKQEKTSGTFAPDWPANRLGDGTTPYEIPGVKRLTLTVTWDDKRRNLVFVRYVVPGLL